MLNSQPLDEVYRSIDKSLGVKTRHVTKRVPITEFGYMIPGQSPRTRYRTEVAQEQVEQWSKLAGILFCTPTSKLGKDEILPNLDYFHHRSAQFVDFFCVGYSRVRPHTERVNTSQPVATVNGKAWNFSSSDFNQCRARVEAESKWRYSGETDLLLVVARKPKNDIAYLDFSCAIACNLEEMARDGAISSARAFFEKIFRFGEQYGGIDPVSKLSDQFGLAAGGTLLQESILTLLPEQVRKQYNAVKHLAVADVSL